MLLSDKFQRAVDRAKRKAHIYTAHEDIAQWRRESRPCEGDLAKAATALAVRIEGEYSAIGSACSRSRVAGRRMSVPTACVPPSSPPSKSSTTTSTTT